MRSNFNSLSALSNIIFVSFAGRINIICARLCSFGLVACAVSAKANALFRCGVRRSRAITPLAPVYPGLYLCSVCAAASIKRVGEYLILRAVSRPRSFCCLLFRFCPAVFMAANADAAFFCPAVFSTLSLCGCKRSRGFFCCAVFASTKSKRGVFDVRRDCFDASLFAGSVVGGMRKATENY